MAENDDLLEFDFAEVDEKEFELHLQHHGVEQPDNITGPDQLRKKGVVLCGRLAEAVHGHMKAPINSKVPNTRSDPCTLAIFEWYVHTRDPGLRIKFACIDITFCSAETSGSDGGSKYDLWVKNCAPWGSYSLHQTLKTLEKTKGWRPSIKLGQDGIANAEIPFVYELKETVERGEQIYVDGCPLPPKDGMYVHPDRFSAVRWSLFENEGQQSGIPRYFRTAVLLDRTKAKDAKFKAQVDIKVKVSTYEDAKEKVKRFFGQNIKDDSLVFNPALPPKTNRFDDEIDDLGSDGVNLDDEAGFLLFKNNIA